MSFLDGQALTFCKKSSSNLMFVRKWWHFSGMLIQTQHMDHVFTLHVLNHQHCKQTLCATKQWVDRAIIAIKNRSNRESIDPLREEITSVYLSSCLSFCTIHVVLLLSLPWIMLEYQALCFVSDFRADTGRWCQGN